MITVKKFIRTAGVLLLTVLLLNSCGSKNVEDFPFVPLDVSDTADKISEYRIIVSSVASAELTSAAEKLRDGLREKTSVAVTLRYDSDGLPDKDKAWDIYVGNTGYDLSRQALRNMRSDDYTCRSFDGYSILGGKSDSSTVTAINRYISELLPVASDCAFIPEGGGFDFFGEYKVGNITLLDSDISLFELVYALNDSVASAEAYGFRSELARRTGYYLDVVSGYSYGKSILFKTDLKCNAGEAYISLSEGGITVRASSAYGLNAASEKLLDIICPEGSEGGLSPSLTGEIFVAYTEPVLDLSFFCLSGILPIDAPDEITDISSAARDNSPDGLWFGALEASDKARLKIALSDYVDVSAEGGSAVFALPLLSSELICSERADGLTLEGYRLSGNGLELALLYVSGSSESDVTLEIPAELASTGLPTIVVIHTFNGGQVSAVCGDNENFEKVCSDVSALYGDSFSFTCYADTGRLSVSTVAEKNSCGYRQISVRGIG